MKFRLFILIVFVVFPAPALRAQLPVSVSGYVTALETGYAIPDKEVSITMPPGNEPLTTTTNDNGFYAFQFVYVPGDSLAQIAVTVIDCAQQPVSQFFVISNSNVITADFQICTTGSGCSASFGYVAQPANPLMVSFLNLSNPVSYSTHWFWDFGDGSSSFDFEPIHTYSQPGVYTVCLSMTDSTAGCTALYCADVPVSNNNAGCQAYYTWQGEGLSLQFTDLSQGNPSTWYWNFGDGTGSTLPNPIHTWSFAGEYEVCLTIGNDSLICSDTYCGSVSVGDTLTPCHAAYTYSNQQTNTLAFTNLSTGMYIYQFIWDFGDGSTSSEFEPVHTWQQAGIYHVCLAINGFNCGDVYCSDITVGDTVSTCQAGFTAICDSVPGNMNHYWFTDASTGTGISSWYWDFGDGTVSFLPSAEHTYELGGSYTVCHAVNGYGNNGYCADTLCQTIVTPVYSNMGGQIFAGNFPINNPQNTGDTAMVILCRKNGDLLTPVASGIFYEYGYYYFLDVMEGNYVVYSCLTPNSASYASFLPSYTGETQHWQEAVEVGLSGSDVFDANVFMRGFPALESGNGLIAGNLLCIDNAMVDLSGQVVFLSRQGNIVAYTQTGANGEFRFSSVPYSTYTLTAEIPGMYSQAVEIVVNETSNQLYGNQIQVAHSGIYGIEEPATGLSFSIYPNPAEDQINLRFMHTGTMSCRLSLVTATGTLLNEKTVTLTAGECTIPYDISALPAGLYMIVCTTADKRQVVGVRLIKQ